MKNQALFSWKDKSKNLKRFQLKFYFGALRLSESSAKQQKLHQTALYFFTFIF